MRSPAQCPNSQIQTKRRNRTQLETQRLHRRSIALRKAAVAALYIDYPLTGQTSGIGRRLVPVVCGVDFGKVLPFFGQVIGSIDRGHRACRYAGAAINTFHWINV
jgi:hypothetical protein